MIIQEYVNVLIEEKREEIISESGSIFDIKNDIKSTNEYKIYTFKKLYKVAKQTRKEKDIDNAIKYYESNKMINYHIKSLEKLYKELLSMKNVFIAKRNEINYKKKWAHRNGKDVTISEIGSHLKVIIDKYNKDPECIKDCDKYNANLICDLFESGRNDCIYQIIDGDQEANCKMLKWSYKIGKQLEDELPVSVEYGDGDEGCLYIEF